MHRFSPCVDWIDKQKAPQTSGCLFSCALQLGSLWRLVFVFLLRRAIGLALRRRRLPILAILRRTCLPLVRRSGLLPRCWLVPGLRRGFTALRLLTIHFRPILLRMILLWRIRLRTIVGLRRAARILIPRRLRRTIRLRTIVGRRLIHLWSVRLCRRRTIVASGRFRGTIVLGTVVVGAVIFRTGILRPVVGRWLVRFRPVGLIFRPIGLWLIRLRPVVRLVHFRPVAGLCRRRTIIPRRRFKRAIRSRLRPVVRLIRLGAIVRLIWFWPVVRLIGFRAIIGRGRIYRLGPVRGGIVARTFVTCRRITCRRISRARTWRRQRSRFRRRCGDYSRRRSRRIRRTQLLHLLTRHRHSRISLQHLLSCRK